MSKLKGTCHWGCGTDSPKHQKSVCHYVDHCWEHDKGIARDPSNPCGHSCTTAFSKVWSGHVSTGKSCGSLKLFQTSGLWSHLQIPTWYTWQTWFKNISNLWAYLVISAVVCLSWHFGTIFTPFHTQPVVHMSSGSLRTWSMSLAFHDPKQGRYNIWGNKYLDLFSFKSSKSSFSYTCKRHEALKFAIICLYII